jgi:hypothetical protein
MALFDEDDSGASVAPLRFIRTYLALAIQIGAPAYNAGDHRGCYEVYACTARLLVNGVKGADAARDQLKDALERCATVADVNQQAWILRRAFDAVLDETQDN